MTGYISIDGLCWEIQSVMKSNFEGTPTERFNQTKELLIDDFKEIIEDNRVGEIAQFKENRKSEE